jgi:hypothetical protein
MAVVFLATGLLVSSGFAFNEIFVYWFPNFGFAYLFLAILCSLQFFPKKNRLPPAGGICCRPCHRNYDPDYFRHLSNGYGRPGPVPALGGPNLKQCVFLHGVTVSFICRV